MRPAEGARRGVGAAGLALALALTAAPAPAQDLVFGSKQFAESNLLAEMLAQLVRARTGLEVEHASGLGGTLVCFEALRAGEIDLYPEYTGTAWAVVLEREERVADPLRTYLGVAARYRELFELEWLQPFGFDNSYVLAMAEPRAAALGVRTISDLAEHAAELTGGFSIEFTEREDGWPGLAAHYGLELGRVRAMEHALAYDALAAGELDLVDAYATDGRLRTYDLRLLADDRDFFPPYHAAPVVRRATLAAHPKLRAVLDELAFRLTDEVMTDLNHRVEVRREAAAAVARSFLVAEGLVAALPGEPAPRGPLPGATDAPSSTDRSGVTERLGATEGFGALLARFPGFFAARWRETLRLLGEHVVLTASAVALAALLAVPAGIWITRHALLERVALGLAGVVQTIPSLALLAFMIAIPGLGLSVRSAVVALFLYAVLPILRNAVTGIRGVDPSLVDAARGMGLTDRELLWRVELPLAMPTIMAGVRTATVISVGVATLAAFIGAGGLGEPIVQGLYLNDRALVLAGALPAALLALGADAGLGLLERALTPRGIR